MTHRRRRARRAGRAAPPGRCRRGPRPTSPRASLVAGSPNRITERTPSPTSRCTSPRSESRCAGRGRERRDRPRRVHALGHEEWRDEVLDVERRSRRRGRAARVSDAAGGAGGRGTPSLRAYRWGSSATRRRLAARASAPQHRPRARAPRRRRDARDSATLDAARRARCASSGRSRRAARRAPARSSGASSQRVDRRAATCATMAVAALDRTLGRRRRARGARRRRPRRSELDRRARAARRGGPCAPPGREEEHGAAVEHVGERHDLSRPPRSRCREPEPPGPPGGRRTDRAQSANRRGPRREEPRAASRRWPTSPPPTRSPRGRRSRPEPRRPTGRGPRRRERGGAPPSCAERRPTARSTARPRAPRPPPSGSVLAHVAPGAQARTEPRSERATGRHGVGAAPTRHGRPRAVLGQQDAAQRDRVTAQRANAPPGTSQPAPSSARNERSQSSAVRAGGPRSRRAARAPHPRPRTRARAPPAHLGDEPLGVEALGDASGEAEPRERRRRDHDRVDVTIERGESPRDVPPQPHDVEIRTHLEQQGAPARCTGGHGGPRGQHRERPSDEASAGSARSGTAARTSPGGETGGRSLAECTATSALPSSTAACTSFVNTPRPASAVNATSPRRSPSVSTTTSSAATPTAARRVDHRGGLRDRER